MLALPGGGLTEAQIDAIAEYMAAKSRESFWCYRQMMNPGMKIGWFQRDVAKNLRWFYDEMMEGTAPVLMLFTPPQHGKSLNVLDFVAWALGKNPDLQTIFTSFSDRLGVRANLRVQRALDNPKYQRTFPGTKLSPRGVITLGGLRNSEMLEIVGRHGSFRNTTVRGAVTGESLDLGVIDDPIKGRAEAQSDVERERVWNWFTDDFYTRFSEKAALLLIMTRWHLDDPAGRIIDMLGRDRVRIVRYPALAEHDEEFRKQGDPLFPELKSLDFLQRRRAVLSLSSWESIYQQNPIVVGGGIFPIGKILTLSVMPALDQIAGAVRYIDKAGTATEESARTAMVLMFKMRNGTFVVADVQAGHWGALEREQNIKHIAESDRAWLRGVSYEIMVEQEPGSGGKESAEATIRMLPGFNVYADRVSGQGSKEVRADPFAAQVQGGNVFLVAGAWNAGYLDELEVFPNAKLKDQVDASSGAFNRLTGGSNYDTSMDWAQ